MYTERKQTETFVNCIHEVSFLFGKWKWKKDITRGKTLMDVIT